MAPGAAIVLAVAATSSGNAINEIESTVIPMFPGAIMSQSVGIPEILLHGNNAQVMQAEANYALADSLGWTIFASAGDSGATNGFATPNAGFPASDPLVTSVGGTEGNPYLLFGPKSGCNAICSAGLSLYDNATGMCPGKGHRSTLPLQIPPPANQRAMEERKSGTNPSLLNPATSPLVEVPLACYSRSQLTRADSD